MSNGADKAACMYIYFSAGTVDLHPLRGWLPVSAVGLQKKGAAAGTRL